MDSRTILFSPDFPADFSIVKTRTSFGTVFGYQMEMGRTCRKASPHQIGAGNNYVGPLERQEKQRQAKHQMGRLFQQTSGTTDGQGM